MFLFAWFCTRSDAPLIPNYVLYMVWKVWIIDFQGAIHSTKIPTGPTGKSGPPQKVDPFFRNFSGWTEPIHWVLDRNFRTFWLNGSRPQITRYKNKRKKEKEFYMDWKLERSLSEMTCKKQILALVSFTALETKRNLGHVNFSKEFWDCYWGQGKQIAE